MKLRFLTLLVLFFRVLSTFAQTPTEKLPVRRVVLYKNGVGYFEHTGRIRGDQEIKIDFTSAQLNDVLKSLTVLDLNGGKSQALATTPLRPSPSSSNPCVCPWDNQPRWPIFFPRCAVRAFRCAGEQCW